MRTWVKVAVVGAAAALLTGCNRYGYDAHIESVTWGAHNFLTVDGWVHDPLLAKRKSCADVVLTANGQELTRESCVGASEFGNRPDVDRALGRWNGEFQNEVMTDLHKGSYQLCVDVVPTGDPPDAKPLDCTSLVIAEDQHDEAVIDTITATGTTVTAAGWTFLADLPRAYPTVGTGWALDGSTTLPAGATVTSYDRPDVVAAVGGGSGTSVTMTVAPGTHTLCLVVDDGFDDSLTNLACRTFTAS